MTDDELRDELASRLYALYNSGNSRNKKYREFFATMTKRQNDSAFVKIVTTSRVSAAMAIHYLRPIIAREALFYYFRENAFDFQFNDDEEIDEYAKEWAEKYMAERGAK